VARAAALLGAVTVAGCGLGPGGSSEGVATLTVTRDFGAQRLLEASVEDPSESETVVRFLDREAALETNYGGNFVDSIDGIAGAQHGGRRSDWFFYVNGYWSPVGAAEAGVRPGDRIWWDYRDWEAAYRVPAVVGSWPQPFLTDLDGESVRVRVVCFTAALPCKEVSRRLDDAGADLGGPPGSGPASGPRRELDGDGGSSADAGDEVRVLVGPWQRIRRDRAASVLEGGLAGSGVYAEFDRLARGWELVTLDARGRERDRLGAGAGLVAAVRLGERPPSWLVTGTDAAGVEAAVELLDAEALRDRYAVVAQDGGATPLPAAAAEEGD
jgi:hypothetical protein